MANSSDPFAKDMTGKTNTGWFAVRPLSEQQNTTQEENYSCTDGISNGFETDVDCGGYDCIPCSLNKSCQFNNDCGQKYCNNESKCDIPSCNDTIKNGFETDIDCGGNCTKCSNGMDCEENSDCISNYCSMGTCDIEGQEYQPPQTSGSNKPIVLLIFSLLLIFGGAGYIIYKKYFMKKPPIQPSSIQQQGQPMPLINQKRIF